MSDMKHSPDLSSLESDYEIVGELGTSGGARRYVGKRYGEGSKRRDDQTGVLITVVTTPEGDEGHALSQFAADTQLLARTTHRRLVPVIEGRWAGTDAFAVVTQRLADPTLAQRLATGETFTNPRIAAILREVNGLLEWAREQKIVHRNITADSIYLEPKTDRVRVSFAIAPRRRLHQSDADDDARTIARLALAMLTGEHDPQAHEGQTLAELRPDLPARLGEATAALLDEKKTGTPADVAAYLAMIGMADPIAAGESERDRIRDEILEEQRLEREKLAAERAEFERQMAAERASLEQTMEAERARVARQRAELEKAVTNERAELQRALSEERAALAAKRAELERLVAGQRAEMERVAAQDRQRIEALRAEIRRAGELEIEKKRQAALEDITDTEDALDQGELATPQFVSPMFAPIEPLVFDDDSPVMSDEEITFEPAREERSAADVPGEPVAVASDAASRRRWIVGGALAGIIALAAASAVVIGNRNATARSVVTPVVKSAPAATAPIAVAPPPASVVPLPPPTPAIVDSAAGDAARTAGEAARTAGEAPRTSDSTVRAARRRDSTRAVVAARAAARPRPVVTRDSSPRPAARTLGESLFFIPGAPTPIRQTPTARPDSSTPRPDTSTPPSRE